ncbi:MAG: hypothetical protein LBQ22_05395 [Bacteroidales bacterium]|jgi:hypothetical protein|nr:hypothetical protein [Bacteroidales bacterium]
MKKRILPLLTVISFSLFNIACSQSQVSEFKPEDLGKKENIVQQITAEDINTIIEHKEYTALFFYTTWCGASIENLETHIKNTLDTLDLDDEELSIAIIGLAKNKNQIEELTKKYDINYTTYYLNSPIGSGIDKSVINKTLKKIFNDYESKNSVPIGLLCNNKKEILLPPAGYIFNNIIEAYYRQK